MSGSLPQSGVQLVAAGVSSFLGDMGKARGAVDDFDGATGRASGGAGRAFSAIGSAAGAVATVVAGAMAAAGLAVAGFVAGAVSKSIDFEKQISGVGAVLQATPEQVDALRDSAIEMGAETAYSATESAEAFEMLAQNGLTATQILDGAGRATADLAAATGGDMTTAADVASSTMLVFGKRAEDMADVINGVTGVTIASKFDLDDYRLALAQGGGAAAGFGVSLDEFNTSIAATSEYFGSGSDAGTAFKTFLTRLVPASGPAEKAMYDLGIITEDGTNRFFDATGKMKDMSEITKILAESTAGLSEEKKIDALQTAFGSDAMRMAIGLAATGVEGYDAVAAAIAKVDANEQARLRLDNLAGSIEQSKGAFESLQLVVGGMLAPVLKGFLDDVLIPLLQILTTFAQQGLSFEALTSLGMFLSDINPALGSFVANLALADDPIAALKEGLLALLGDVVAQLPGQLATLTQTLLGAILAALPGIISTLTQWRGAFLQWILDAMPGMGANLATFLQGLLTQVGAALPSIVSALATYADSFVQWIIVALPVFLTELGAFIASMLDYLLENAPSILSTLGEWTVQFVLWAADTGVKLIVAMGELFGKFLAWFIEVAPRIQSTMKEWEKATTRWILESWPGWLRELGALWGKLKGWIGEKVTALSSDGSLGKALIDGIKKGIDGAIAGLVAKAAGAVRAAISAAQNAGIINSPSRAMADMVGLPLGQGMAVGIERAYPAISAASMGGVRAAMPNMARLAQPSTTTNYGPSYSMPVYTNNTPAALQQSLAVVEALST